MDTSKSPPRKDASGTKSGRFSDPIISSPSDTVGGDRITVQSLEREAKAKSRRREYSNSRSRRNRKKEEEGSGKYLWLSVLFVALGYLGLLGYETIRSRSKTPPVPVVPTKQEPVLSPTEEAATVDAGDTVAVPEAEVKTTGVSTAMPIADLIANAKRARQLADEGGRLVRDRNLAMAEAKFEEAALLLPHDAEILMSWAKVLFEQKKWPAARDVLLRLTSVEANSVQAKVMLARVFYQLRQSDDALSVARWVLESEPYSEEAHQIAADVYTQTERHEQSIEHWQRLVALNSNNHVAENNLGVAQMRVGRINQAIRTFENVIRDEPGNSQAYYYLSLCYLQKGEQDIAVDMLIRATDRFGSQFVHSWTYSAEFEVIKTHPAFLRHFADVMASPAEAARQP